MPKMMSAAADGGMFGVLSGGQDVAAHIPVGDHAHQPAAVFLDYRDAGLGVIQQQQGLDQRGVRGDGLDLGVHAHGNRLVLNLAQALTQFAQGLVDEGDVVQPVFHDSGLGQDLFEQAVDAEHAHVAALFIDYRDVAVAVFHDAFGRSADEVGRFQRGWLGEHDGGGGHSGYLRWSAGFRANGSVFGPGGD